MMSIIKNMLKKCVQPTRAGMPGLTPDGAWVPGYCWMNACTAGMLYKPYGTAYAIREAGCGAAKSGPLGVNTPLESCRRVRSTYQGAVGATILIADRASAIMGFAAHGGLADPARITSGRPARG
jgi:hypothetical protein